MDNFPDSAQSSAAQLCQHHGEGTMILTPCKGISNVPTAVIPFIQQ